MTTKTLATKQAIRSHTKEQPNGYEKNQIANSIIFGRVFKSINRAKPNPN